VPIEFHPAAAGHSRLLFSEALQSGDPLFRDRMNELVMFFLNFIAA